VKIRASPQRREEFEQYCHAASVKPNELIVDVRTRWNSTFSMIERALLLKEVIYCSLLQCCCNIWLHLIKNFFDATLVHLKPLDVMAGSVQDLQKYILSDNDWNVLKEMKNWLMVSCHGTNVVDMYVIIFW